MPHDFLLILHDLVVNTSMHPKTCQLTNYGIYLQYGSKSFQTYSRTFYLQGGSNQKTKDKKLYHTYLYIFNQLLQAALKFCFNYVDFSLVSDFCTFFQNFASLLQRFLWGARALCFHIFEQSQSRALDFGAFGAQKKHSSAFITL